jgi:D-lyxose ketol-isomerase
MEPAAFRTGEQDERERMERNHPQSCRHFNRDSRFPERRTQMKRSRINRCIREMERMASEHSFPLPPFLSFTPEAWKTKGHEYDEIRDNVLGWDITDCGLGEFDRIGFSLITLRNGNRKNPKYKKVYAEKLIFLKEGQTFPFHFHVFKSEDIINRGGGILVIHVYNDDGKGGFSQEPVLVNSDGRSYRVPAGTGVQLKPGESITLWPHQYHDFGTVSGTGDILIGEVSQCNDDRTDNFFHDPVGRFPEIEEDEEPYRLLCNEYPEAE